MILSLLMVHSFVISHLGLKSQGESMYLKPNHSWSTPLILGRNQKTHARHGRTVVNASLKSSNPSSIDINPVFGSRFAADGKELDEVTRKTISLVQSGRLEDAYKNIYSFEQKHLWEKGVTTDLTIECELLTGRYRQALQDSQQLLATPGRNYNENYYLCLSLAASGLGRIYTGQDDYTRLQSYAYMRQEGVGGTILVSPSIDGPRRVMVESALALGINRSPISNAFLDLTLRLDPLNEIAIRTLVSRYDNDGQYVDAARVASKALTGLRPGPFRDYMSGVSAMEEAKANQPPLAMPANQNKP